MSELAYAPLESFADVIMGQSPGADLCNTEDKGLPFLQGSAEFGTRNPKATIYCAPPLRIAKVGSILTSVRAPVGTLNYADQDYCIGRGLGSFKAKNGISNTIFLKHAVELNAAYLHRRSQGSTFSAVSTDDVRSIPIPVFEVAKQEKLATIFIGIDTAVERTEALIDKYLQLKTGLMQDMFTRGVLPNGQLRPPRSEASELYQKTAIGWIPKDWSIKKTAEVLDSIADGPFGSNLKTEHYVIDPGVRVVRLQNVAEYQYNDGDRAYVSSRHAAYLVRNKVVGGDVLIAGLGEERYPVGRACTYPSNLPPAINKADCFRARCILDVMHNKFFMLFLNSELARQQIRRYEQGVTRPRINTGNLKRLLVGVPSLHEQVSIIKKIEAAQTTIRTQQMRVENLKAQKLGLMQDLLTGKVPVKVDEPDAGDA